MPRKRRYKFYQESNDQNLYGKEISQIVFAMLTNEANTQQTNTAIHSMQDSTNNKGLTKRDLNSILRMFLSKSRSTRPVINVKSTKLYSNQGPAIASQGGTATLRR